MYFWLSSTTTILFAVLLNPFIELWIGNAYVLNEVTVLFILINYYILMMRRLLISYRNALGLYVQAKYKPVYESVINIVASLILLRYFGVLGVVIGTTISELATSMWIEPYVLYKHYFVEGQREYWRKYISYFAFTILTSGVLVLARSNVSITDFGFLVVTAVITFAVSNFMIIILFRRTDDYRHANQDLAKHLKWRK
jgi:O-antigen/teichoic acid export membrane protein